MNESLRMKNSRAGFKAKTFLLNFLIDIEQLLNSALSELSFISFLHFRRVSVAKYFERIEFNVVASCALFMCQLEFSHAFKSSFVGGFEFIMLGNDAQEAVNLKSARNI